MTDIAIVGMSCRFPGAGSVPAFRSLLREGRCAIREFGRDEILDAGVPESVVSRRGYVGRGAPLEAVREYDTEVFGIRAEDAATMDPQIYHMLECTSEALESAGCGKPDTISRTGIFVGADQSIPALRSVSDDVLWDPMGQWGTILVNDPHFLATQVAFRLGLRGPAIAVQTACSTSLVAVHLAVQSLLAGDCDVAVAGGVSIRGAQTRGYLHRVGTILSPTGTCRPFDSEADGTILSSGAGVVVLRRLEEAVTGGFPIWAVVKGSAVNNDGGKRLAYSAPSGDGQVEVIQEAMRVAGVHPHDVGYVEAHGTATSLGDQVELQALRRAFGALPGGSEPCRLGSVKSNFGHLETAAGVAGLIKTALSIRYNEVYSTCGFRRYDPDLGLDGGTFSVAGELAAFPAREGPRLAGVSSFGIGGTNCHIILQEAPEPRSPVDIDADRCFVLGVSAATPRALEKNARLAASVLAGLPAARRADALFTLLAGRRDRVLRVAQVVDGGPGSLPDPDAGPGKWSLRGDASAGTPAIVFRLPRELPDAGDLEAVRRRLQRRTAADSVPDLAESLMGLDFDSGAGRREATVLLCAMVAHWLRARGVDPTGFRGQGRGLLAGMMAGAVAPAELARLVLDGSFEEDPDPVPPPCGYTRRIEVDLLAPRSAGIGPEGGGAISAMVLDSPDSFDRQLTRCLAELWVWGVDVDWNRAFGDGRVRVELPTYAFDRHEVVSRDSGPVATRPREAADVGRTDEVDEIVARTWVDLLGVTPADSDRFLDSGGDSLSAVRFASRLEELLGRTVEVDTILGAESFSSLVRAVREDRGPRGTTERLLSPGQEAIWLEHHQADQTPAFNVQFAMRIDGALQLGALRKAIDGLVARHGALRTVFLARAGEVLQVEQEISPRGQWRYRGDVQESMVTSLLIEHGRTTIDLGTSPLMDVLVLSTGARRFYLSVVTHHIVSDEWSAQLMAREVMELYSSNVENRQPVLAPLTSTYGEQAEGLRQGLVSAEALGRLEYWQSKLAGLTRMEMPIDRRRRASRRFRGAALATTVPRDVVEQLTAVARDHGGTPFMVLSAAFAVFLGRYCGQDDICFGTNVAAREQWDARNMVGLFTNVVPLRCVLDPHESFASLLARMRETVIEAQSHQVPLAALVRHLAPRRPSARNPLVDVTLVLQNVPREVPDLDGLTVEQVRIHNGTSKFDLELCLQEGPDGCLQGYWEYDTDLFEAESIETMDEVFLRILSEAARSPEISLSRISLLSERARQQIVDNARSPSFALPHAGPWEEFSRQAARRPDAVALSCRNGIIRTYAELHEQSSLLADRLAAAGARPGALCGIFSQRSEEYLRAVLATQACESAFLPLDPALPDARLADMIADARVDLVLVGDPQVARLRGTLGATLDRETRWLSIGSSGVGGHADGASPNPGELAYVIYTSGSTGRPRGVMVAKRGMLNHLWCKIRSLHLDAGSVVAFTAPVCFDISVWQMLAPLMVGGTISLVAESEVKDVDGLLGRLVDDRVTVMECVPGYLDLLVSAIARTGNMPTALRHVVSTGEPLPVETCRRWFGVCPGIPLVNAYGPTECSDDVTQEVIREPVDSTVARIAIGRALENMAVHVLDERLEPVPDGMWGEICVAGICVGLGYLGDEAGTRKAFVPDPFSSNAGDLLYRTGDTGRRRSDGSLEYLGRRDTQIKVRGVRIEIEELESALGACGAIEEVVVTPDERKESLLALVRLRNGAAPDAAVREIRAFASRALPESMCPARWLVVAEIPRSPSGKIDRIAVRALAGEAQATAADAAPEAKDRLYAELEAIFACVIGVNPVPPDVDFFELGGDSLRAMRLVSLAREAGVDVSVEDVLALRTLEAIWSKHRRASGDVQ
ncbi:MAG: amino acid adenylation domain-containing protein [bacterium]